MQKILQGLMVVICEVIDFADNIYNKYVDYKMRKK